MAVRTMRTSHFAKMQQSTNGRGHIRVSAASQPSMRSFDSPASQNGASTAPERTPTSMSADSTPVITKTYRLSAFDAMKFNAAPEKINSRLAMLAIVLVAQREMATGELAVQQFLHPDWRVVVGMLLVIHGTMVQVVKGAKDEDFGPFTVLAEKVNGRLAMLGCAALLALEYYSNVPFF